MADKIDEAMQTMVRNLAEKTGKTLEQWTSIAAKSGFAKHGEIVKFLKAEHALGHGYANLVAHATKDIGTVMKSEGTNEDLVEAQYAGAKAALKPIYNKLLAAIQKFGDDVEVSPKRTYVSLRRSKQFALIQPTTATRVDVGIQLKGEKPGDRLEASGSFNSMVSHRVRIEDAKGVDKELIAWLKKAYEAA